MCEQVRFKLYSCWHEKSRDLFQTQYENYRIIPVLLVKGSKIFHWDNGQLCFCWQINQDVRWAAQTSSCSPWAPSSPQTPTLPSTISVCSCLLDLCFLLFWSGTQIRLTASLLTSVQWTDFIPAAKKIYSLPYSRNIRRCSPTAESAAGGSLWQ